MSVALRYVTEVWPEAEGGDLTSLVPRARPVERALLYDINFLEFLGLRPFAY
jgi:hypothetical protein